MSFSKKYYAPSDPNTFIYATWEKNWTNIKIYGGGKIIYQNADSSALLNGVEMEIENLGTVRLQLTDPSSSLQVSLDGVSYLEGSEPSKSVDFSGLSAVFWVLTGFSGLVVVFELLFLGGMLSHPLVLIGLIIDLVVTIVYGATAVLIKRKVYWMYYVGASIFVLFTAFMLLNYEGILADFRLIVIVIIRLVFLYFILRSFKDVNYAMQNLGKKKLDGNILDD